MKKIIVANWKMNPPNLIKAEQLFNSVKKGIKNFKNIEIVICPPFIYLSRLLLNKRKSQIKFGAQNCFWEKSGAFTGEISPEMLKNLNCQYVILGHSERREYLRETDGMIAKKIKVVLEAKLKAILCIGETEQEKREFKTKEILRKKLQEDLKEIQNYQLKTKNLILAYEPIWAIGTKNPCLAETAQEILLFLREILKDVPILYGGSVNSENAQNYIKVGFDGLLVGGASLKAEEFLKIVKNIQKLKY